MTDGSDNGHSISVAVEDRLYNSVPPLFNNDTRGARKTGMMVCRATDWNDPTNARRTYSDTTSFNSNTYMLDMGARFGATNRGFAQVGFMFSSGGPTMYLGETEVDSLILGTNEIDAVFLGSTEV